MNNKRRDTAKEKKVKKKKCYRGASTPDGIRVITKAEKGSSLGEVPL